ncbi:hypothetical protein [Thermus caldilimi]|uniref:hypothetical protein n=1 Tax=Thermus caldilimi TaxID=2483360 RepID=UPI001075E83D|nr:hypothetical protein [Thermus caldilimi]
MKNGKGKQAEREVLRAFTTREYEDSEGETRTYWVQVGRAFRSEKGITVLLDALPLNGKLVLLPPNEEAEAEEEEEDVITPRKRR